MGGVDLLVELLNDGVMVFKAYYAWLMGEDLPVDLPKLV